MKEGGGVKLSTRKPKKQKNQTFRNFIENLALFFAKQKDFIQASVITLKNT